MKKHVRRLVALHIFGERVGQYRHELSHPFNASDAGNKAMLLLLQDVRDWVVEEIAHEWQSFDSSCPNSRKPAKSRRKTNKASRPETRRYTSE